MRWPNKRQGKWERTQAAATRRERQEEEIQTFPVTDFQMMRV